jgi:hypothetical protein
MNLTEILETLSDLRRNPSPLVVPVCVLGLFFALAVLLW